MELYGINCLHINGRLTRDPQINKAQNGNDYMTISIARNFYNKTKGNQVMYLDCYAYGNYLINSIQNNKNFTRGANVMITGNIQGYNTRVNESDNESIATLKINVQSIVHVEFPTVSSSDESASQNNQQRYA